jgi:acyl-coenzyme A thioesterase PaaI-like protein
MNRFTVLVALLLLVSGGFVAAQADSITVQARLVHGTSKEQKGKMEVPAAIKKKLARVFKWMHYYQLNSKRLNIADATTKTTKLSKTTSIKVTNRKNGRIAVSLYSKGKMLVQKTQTLRPGSYMVLAGSAGTDSAWFIVLSKSK